MAKTKNVQHPLEAQLLQYPEDAAVRVTVMKDGMVTEVAEEFLKDVLTRRGGSSKRPDMLKAKLRNMVAKGTSFQVEAL